MPVGVGNKRIVEGATIVPHPDRPNCLRPHVVRDPPVKLLARNTFRERSRTPRWYLPHRIPTQDAKCDPGP